MKTMILSRFSSSKRLRQRAMPSPPNKAELKLGSTCGLGGGSGRLLLLPQAKSGRQPHDQQGQVAMHHHCRFGALGEVQQMPGMLAFFEDAIFNHTAPIIGVKDHERIVDLSIG